MRFTDNVGGRDFLLGGIFRGAPEPATRISGENNYEGTEYDLPEEGKGSGPFGHFLMVYSEVL